MMIQWTALCIDDVFNGLMILKAGNRTLKYPALVKILHIKCRETLDRASV